jgi:hypothetical protein
MRRMMTRITLSCFTSSLLAAAACGAPVESATSSGSALSSGADDAVPGSGLAADAAAPNTCGAFTVPVVPNAPPHVCALSPADVSCDADADCKVMVVGHCGCFDQAYGVNGASTARCIPPPCAPPLPGHACTSRGYDTQDCSETTALADVGVACIGHVCSTFAKP